MNKLTGPPAFADIPNFEPALAPKRKVRFAPNHRGETNMPNALADPLATVKAIAKLLEQSKENGLELAISSDFEELQRTRHEARGDQVSPMFDPEISLLDDDRAFWLCARLASGRPIALQAFRLDIVHPNLAEWALGWMAGLYLKRKELVLPRRVDPPFNTRAQLMSGKLVYHGELWIDRHHRNRHCFDIFPRAGMLLAYMKWLPSGLWSLVSESMATRGHMVRMGYGHLERGFFSWEWEPNGAEQVEWVGLADSAHLEHLISDMVATEELYQPSSVP
jgi:hypothetical protein